MIERIWAGFRGIHNISPPAIRPPEIPVGAVNLAAEYERQSRRYIELGFHTELGLSEKDYLASLPKLEPQPENFCGRFDISVLVDPRVSIERQCELAGINCSDYKQSLAKGSMFIYDWPEDPQAYRTPAGPYLTWVHDGTRNLDKNAKSVRLNLAGDERGGTIFDGIALYIAHPQILGEHTPELELPGSQVEIRGCGGWDTFHDPLLTFFTIYQPGPHLSYIWVGGNRPKAGSVTCGRS